MHSRQLQEAHRKNENLPNQIPTPHIYGRITGYGEIREIVSQRPQLVSGE